MADEFVPLRTVPVRGAVVVFVEVAAAGWLTVPLRELTTLSAEAEPETVAVRTGRV